MNPTYSLRNPIWRLTFGLTFAVIFTLVSGGAALATAEQSPPASQSDSPDWLEPEGISVIDLVGNVPEAHLKDAIITYSGLGIVQYVAGQRQGDRVTIDVQISPRYFEASIGTVTQFSCLGDRGWVDSWSTISPASEFRLFYEGADITQNILGMSTLPAGKLQPVTSTRGGNRYGQLVYSDPVFTDDGSLLMPAHRDCTVYIAGEYPTLSGRYTIRTPNFLSTEYLGSQTFDFHTYIGPGDAGDLDSLRRQMSSRFGHRHDKFSLDIPEGADFVLVKFPPIPVDGYTLDQQVKNITKPTAGTYRLGRMDGNALSVDHVMTMGLPLDGQYQDADQCGDSQFLRPLTNIDMLAAPEYFVPTSVTYDPCMIHGGCSDQLLDAIHDGVMSMTIYYYTQERVSAELERIPIRQVGAGWRGLAAASAQAGTAETLPDASPITPSADAPFRLFLPGAVSSIPITPIPEEDRTGCPCGWFAADGRMLDFTPGP